MKNPRFSFAPPGPSPPSQNTIKRSMLILFSVLALTAFAGPPVISACVPQDRLTVRPRKIVLVRSATIAKQFPDRKTANVTYPIIGGLGDPIVLQRIRSLLDFKNIFDYSLQDYRNDSWLSEFGYTVNYNRNFLFDITFKQSGVAAYPDEHSKHFLINLKNGQIIKAVDAFQVDKLGTLAGMVDQKLQAELMQRVTEIKQSSDLDAEDNRSITEGLEQLKFEIAHLEDFSVSARGITFLYDAGLPHVIKAFEPEGRYFFSFSELRPYLKLNGPLGQFVP